MPSLRSGARRAALLDGDPHQLADAVDVDASGTGSPAGSALDVVEQEAALGVVAGVAERHLGQVVGAEAEELGVLGDLVGDVSAPRGTSIIVPNL